MMELFQEDGHLTQYALDALVQDLPLDELSRLEIAEHLSFCDACVDRYSQALENCLLLTPEAGGAKCHAKAQAACDQGLFQ